MKGQNAEKCGRAGKEWWGKRPLVNLALNRNKGMKYWKRLLHKKVRQEGKDNCKHDKLN